jgi:hypothetical protein
MAAKSTPPMMMKGRWLLLSLVLLPFGFLVLPLDFLELIFYPPPKETSEKRANAFGLENPSLKNGLRPPRHSTTNRALLEIRNAN